MTEAEQFVVINTRDWYTAMRTQAKNILTVMATNGFTLDGTDAWISTLVSGVQAEFQIRGEIAFMRVGVKDDAKTPMFTWQAPVGWFS